MALFGLLPQMKTTFRPHDVVTFLNTQQNPLRMVVRAVRSDMCELAPFHDQGTGTTVWVHKDLLLRQRS